MHHAITVGGLLLSIGVLVGLITMAIDLAVGRTETFKLRFRAGPPPSLERSS